MKYFDELQKAMTWLGEQSNTIFIGQAVGYSGTAQSNTLKNVPMERRLELPVFEETQMGMSIGLALSGYLPITVYPRWNFLLCSINQIVNHADKYPLMSDYNPKIIIRVSVGSERPLNPQHQHVGDFTEAVKLMLKTIKMVCLEEPTEIFEKYQEAYHCKESVIMVEYGDFYNEK